ncbi:MAG: M23 family metallopeptidase [Chloroflexi bacterium]|nr:M23 family metallopeptidase [Chloroflexota bacterium]
MFRIRLAPLLLCAAVLTTAAGCGSVFGGENPTPTATAIPPTPTPEIPDLTVFRGFLYPLEGGCLPEGDQLMPNAPREYRGGVHEGVDFYSYDNCATIVEGTPVISAKDGVVLRVDRDYHPLTLEELNAADVRIAAGETSDPDILDLFRGRQVWIDHGKGIVTRYAHLGGVAPDIAEGQRVAAGTVIGYVGDSGTPESISNPGTEIHLHWEVRAGDTFLGAGLPPEEVRAVYQKLFEPLP